MAKKKYFGEAPRESFKAYTDLNQIADPSEAIFPIMSQDSEGTFELIGTGFFIAEQGLFVTARHVVEAVLGPKGDPCRPFGICQFQPGNKFYMRPIRKTTKHLIADVAVGIAWPMNHNETKAPMPNKVLTLSLKRARVGEPIATYAFPKTTIEREGRKQSIWFEPAYFDGMISRDFPKGAAPSIVKGPCYQTSIVMHGGASGGPVVGECGTVIGVNSSGHENDRLSFVSDIESVMDLALDGVNMAGSAKAGIVTIRELCASGMVARK